MIVNNRNLREGEEIRELLALLVRSWAIVVEAVE